MSTAAQNKFVRKKMIVLGRKVGSAVNLAAGNGRGAERAGCPGKSQGAQAGSTMQSCERQTWFRATCIKSRLQ